MEESVGLLKVIIMQGRKLAIRDFTSSDPYVVVRVGNLTAKTKVINSCLNPVWNEEFTFSLKEPLGILKLEVFDRDRFKSDDKMGHAFLDLRPLASASKLKQALQLTTGETMLRKMAPNSDNCLLADTSVTYVNGEIVLDVCLKLRDVETDKLVESLSQELLDIVAGKASPQIFMASHTYHEANQPGGGLFNESNTPWQFSDLCR